MINVPGSFIFFLSLALFVAAHPASLLPYDGTVVSAEVFESLEELARIVDISYCVGTSGISKPFKCLSRCKEFEGFELVTTWNTGPLLSDSCGYIAVSHAPFEKRVIIAFRGTYSIANTIADLSTNPAEYVPFPTGSNDSICAQTEEDYGILLPHLTLQIEKRSTHEAECLNCTVHSGFMTSWQNTRCTILRHVEGALIKYPGYKLVLVGHSLGGAVAALAALELQARGWKPHITTFGEPRIGNKAFNDFINVRFSLNSTSPDDALFRRVTHVDDPVPLLPPEEWDYHMHAGEIFISKSALPPSREDLRYCAGNEDPKCIAGEASTEDASEMRHLDHDSVRTDNWAIPKRYKLWQLFFAHRDYFWRLGLCIPQGYPWDWWSGEELERYYEQQEL